MDEQIFIYILGRPFSGTTFLDALLGNSRDIEGVGELVRGAVRLREERCSCGEVVEDCEFWRRVRAAFEARSPITWEEAAKIQFRQAVTRSFLRTLFTSRNEKWVDELRRATEDMAAAIREVSGKKAVLDSSKRRARALFLARFVPQARILHLVRDPAGVVNSTYSRNRRSGRFRFFQRDWPCPRPLFFVGAALVALGWDIGLIASWIVGGFARGRMLRVRYEDICARPGEELKRIAEFFGVDLNSVVEAVGKGEDLQQGHLIYGNNMRMSGTFRCNPDAGKWRESLPPFLRILVRLLTWPFFFAYG